MMGEWKEYKLGDVAELTTGFPFKGDAYEVEGELRVIRGENITVGNLRWDSEKFWNHSIVGLKKYFLKEKDIVIGMDGSKVGQNRSLIRSIDLPLILAQRVTLLRAKKGFDQKFIWYQIFNKRFQDYVEAIHTGTSIPHISATQINDFEIFAPSFEEQQNIAEVLSSLDVKIDLLQRQNKTLEQLAETLFRQWFVEEDNNFEEKSLDKIAEFLNGLACQKYPVKSNEEGLPVIKIRELRAGITDNSDIATNDIPAKYLVEDGDMLFSWSGSLDVVLWSGGKGVLNQHLFKVSSNEFPQWFYYLWIKQFLPEFQAIAENKATTMGHIQRHHLSSAMVLVPPKNKLREMDEIVSPLFQKIKTNSQQIKALIKLRDNLLPKLMSGDVRVK